MFSVLFACFLASSLGAVRTYNVVANSNTEWTLSGNTSGVNPILPMVQGDVITVSRAENVQCGLFLNCFPSQFVVAAPGHAFAIHQTAGNTNSNDRYTSGVSGSQVIALRQTCPFSLTVATKKGIANGVITFTVPNNVPNTLFYQCEIHSAMTGAVFSFFSSKCVGSRVVFSFARSHDCQHCLRVDRLGCAVPLHCRHVVNKKWREISFCKSDQREITELHSTTRHLRNIANEEKSS